MSKYKDAINDLAQMYFPFLTEKEKQSITLAIEVLNEKDIEERKNRMSRQQLITDFQHFLDTHKEEVQSHICQPPYDWMDEDDWELEQQICLKQSERGENERAWSTLQSNI